jgi:hypothetical protein
MDILFYLNKKAAFMVKLKVVPSSPLPVWTMGAVTPARTFPVKGARSSGRKMSRVRMRRSVSKPFHSTC